MAKQKVTAETLGTTIKETLEQYAEDVDATVAEVTKAVAKSGVQALKNDSNNTFEDVHLSRGRYGSGWASTVTENRFGASAVIYNKKYPGLPHLLEHGHAKRTGGRVQGRPHIKPVEEQIINEFQQNLVMKL